MPYFYLLLHLYLLQAERAVICVPCMHICMCAECAADIQKRAQPECPVCRGSLEDDEHSVYKHMCQLGPVLVRKQSSVHDQFAAFCAAG
eukprot:scaffold16328_cov18-Tisochrysis_lutea.AAC.1